MRDEDIVCDDDMLNLSIHLSTFPVGQVIDQWYNMILVKHVKKGGRLHLVVHIGRPGEPAFLNAAPAPAPAAQGPPPVYPPRGYPTPGQPAYPTPTAQPEYPTPTVPAVSVIFRPWAFGDVTPNVDIILQRLPNMAII
jgi:hypothetical protein